MEERIDILARRGQRLRSACEYRKAALCYAKLTALDPETPRWWVLLGACLAAARHDGDAAKALRQAMYLLRQRHDDARLAALARYVDSHGIPYPRAA